MARAKYQGSRLTADVQAAILTSLSNGAYFVEACRAAGIPPATGQDWLQKAKTDHPEGLYSEFAEQVANASAKFEVQALALLMTAAKVDWRAALEVLKRRAPERWGDTQRIEMAMQKLARDEIAREVLKAVEDAINDPACRKFFRDDSTTGFYEAVLVRLDSAHGAGAAGLLPT